MASYGNGGKGPNTSVTFYFLATQKKCRFTKNSRVSVSVKDVFMYVVNFSHAIL